MRRTGKLADRAKPIACCVRQALAGNAQLVTGAVGKVNDITDHALHARSADVGAGTAGLASAALAAVLEACRVGRLTRSQHVLLRLGELVAWTECAGSVARRAAAAADGTLPEKSDRRFTAPALAAISRVFARDAALKVADDGLRLVRGAGDGSTDLTSFEAQLRLDDVHAAQTRLLEDMDLVADAVYARTA